MPPHQHDCFEAECPRERRELLCFETESTDFYSRYTRGFSIHFYLFSFVHTPPCHAAKAAPFFIFIHLHLHRRRWSLGLRAGIPESPLRAWGEESHEKDTHVEIAILDDFPPPTHHVLITTATSARETEAHRA
jgi:hypothetical protein